MATQQKKKNGSHHNVISMVMFRYMPYWPIFLILTIICGAIGWAYLNFYAVNKYAVNATILVKDEKKGVEDSKTIEELDAVRSKKIVENEMQVISSKTLLGKVVVNLSLYAPVYEERSLTPVSAYASSPIILVAQDPDKIIMPDEDSDNKFYFSYKDDNNPKVTIGKDTYPMDVWVNTPFGTMMFKKNPAKTKLPSGPLFFSIVSPDRIINSLVQNIEIGAPNKLSSVISLSYEDEEPKRGKDILNELIGAYNQSAINDKKILTDKTLAFLDERIRDVSKQMDSIEENVQNYKSTKGIVELGEQSRLYLQTNQENDKKLTDINMQLTVLDEVERYVASKDSKASIVPSTLGVSDPLLSQMLSKLYDAEVNYEKLKQTTAENNPLLVSVVNEMEKIRPGILETIRSQRRNLQAGQSRLSNAQGSNSTMLQGIPQKEKELVEIKRQQSIKSDVYAYLLNKREETALTRSSLGSDSRVVDAAQASIDPVSPKKLFVYLVAVLIGMILGIIFVSMREFLTNKIIFRTEIENYTSVPVVGEITAVAKQSIFKGKGSKKLAQTILSEQFRQIRMSLKLYRKQGGTKRKLLVTSSIGGEGKSFVSGNLAKSLASSGKKVVLIDMDMRNPKTTNLFGLNDKSGIKEFLEGDKQIEDIIYQTENEHLYLIPAGGLAINPTELLLSSGLGRLFDYLEKNFDFIIADTAPVQPVTDAYVVSEYCDITLFVVRHRYTPKVMVQLLDDNNKIKALKNLNIVFNGVKSRGLLGSTGFGYGYGYGYEYGYGERKYMGQSGKEA